ncbi:hypothetical protein [Streptomyces sp. NPDC003247]|uniref:hypothetical protein n=1 Tax=Streptomyces sp. NPDC003247 TaxID=3364677 RepID=UPI00368FDBF9
MKQGVVSSEAQGCPDGPGRDSRGTDDRGLFLRLRGTESAAQANAAKPAASSGHIAGVTAITEVFGNGQRPTGTRQPSWTGSPISPATGGPVTIPERR